MQPARGTPASVLLRDLFLFHFKLALDGIKGVVMIWLTVMAVGADLLVGGPTRGRRFYSVLRMGERVDLWLNLYGPARNAGANADGIFGESRAGDDSYVGQLEALVAGREPAPATVPRG